MSASKTHFIKESKDSSRVAFISSGKNNLSADSLKVLLDKVRSGERNVSRSFISRTLNVNDVVAECCLRHVEENLKANQGFQDRLMQQLNSLPSSSPNDQAQILRDAFGVNGKVSTAILNHLRTTGA